MPAWEPVWRDGIAVVGADEPPGGSDVMFYAANPAPTDLEDDPAPPVATTPLNSTEL